MMKRFLIYSLAFLLIIGLAFILEGQSFKPVLFKVKDIKDVAKVDATADQYLKMDGTTGLWTPSEFMVGPVGRNLKTWWNFEDFMGPANSGAYVNPGIWQVIAAGTASSSSDIDGLALRPGILELSTGTTNSGSASIITGSNSYSHIMFSAGIYTIESDIYIPILSTAAEQYTLRFGFGQSASGDEVDGAYFEYTDVGGGTPTPNWYKCTANAATRTKTVTTVAVVAGAWTRLKVVVNAAGTSVEYFINGTSVGVLTTNIPTTRVTGNVFSTVKAAGTTARTIDIDWVWLHIDLTTSR
jgi:hypothetical protein